VKGNIVVGNLGWQDYSIAEAKDVRRINLEFGPVSTALGVLGMTGLTAYFGFLEIGEPKKGETVVVSGAAGAVGTIVGQIAKIYGCRVVGIAGSDIKVKYLKDELGFDDAINYHASTDLTKALSDTCPNGVDIYYDNVGGTISDAVITLITTGLAFLCADKSLSTTRKRFQWGRASSRCCFLTVRSCRDSSSAIMPIASIRGYTNWRNG